MVSFSILRIAACRLRIGVRADLLRLLRGVVMAALFCAAAASSTLVAMTNTVSLDWKELPALPDREGFATPFAGVSGGALIVAGGANFPVKRPDGERTRLKPRQ